MNRWKALVVDDQKEILKNLEKILTDMGIKVQTAPNFTEATFIIEHYKFDIAILDIVLPDGNGIDLFRTLRKKNNDIYTIMITGNATVENAITALNEGVNAYLIKPFSDKQFEATLIQADKTLKLKADNQALFDEIHNNRLFYENLLNSNSEAILVVDLDYRIKYCNLAAQNILQQKKDELKNELLTDYIVDGFKILSFVYQQLTLDKPVAGYRVSIKTSETKTFDAHLTAGFLSRENGHVDGLIINLTNPMIHDEVFNRILRKEKLSTITNLANALAHEIRNPINILYGRFQLLLEDRKDEKFKHAFEKIQLQIDRILHTTELLHKFNFNREDSIPELFPISGLFDNIFKEKINKFKEKNIQTSQSIESSKLLLEGNQNQFSDALGYLLEGVIEFTPPDKALEIYGKVTNIYSDSPWYELQFIIPEVKISTEQIINPYQTMDVDLNSHIGLSLTIMHIIFENYGVKIESHVHNGSYTMLRIRFPLQKENLNKKRKKQKKNVN
jgi:CheY-like chemotaxis protein